MTFKFRVRNNLPNNNLTENSSKPSKESPEEKEPFKDRKAMRWMGYGIEFMGVLAIFTYAGWWADEKLEHSWPWLMLIGFGISFVGMMYLLYKETADLRK